MPLNERDEIMFTFASAMNKTAEDAGTNELHVANIMKALGVEVGGGLASLLLGPIGLVGGGVLAAGLLYHVYTAAQETDNSIDELIEALQALDYEGTTAEGWVKGWKEKLASYKKYFMIAGPGEQSEQLMMALNNVTGFKNLVADIAQMESQWPQVKGAVKDWQWLGKFGDVGRAEAIMKQVSDNAQKQLGFIQGKARELASTALQQSKEKGGVDYKAMAQQTIDLYNQVNAAVGIKSLTDEEKAGYELAVQLTQGEVDPAAMVNIQDRAKYMIGLKDLLASVLKNVKPKKAAVKLPLSKRSGVKRDPHAERTLTPEEFYMDKEYYWMQGQLPSDMTRERFRKTYEKESAEHCYQDAVNTYSEYIETPKPDPEKKRQLWSDVLKAQLWKDKVKEREDRAAKKWHESKASIGKPLSKRALTLGDGTQVGMPKPNAPTTPATPQEDTPEQRKIKALQSGLNALRGAHGVGLSELEKDGQYGPLTAQMLSAVMLVDKDLADALNKQGITIKEVLDDKVVNSNPEFVAVIYNVVSSFAAKVKGSEQTTQPATPPAQSGKLLAELWNKPNMNNQELDVFMRNWNVFNPKQGGHGATETAYDFLVGYLMITDVIDRCDLVHQWLGADRDHLPPPTEWANNSEDFVSFVFDAKGDQRRHMGDLGIR